MGFEVKGGLTRTSYTTKLTALRPDLQTLGPRQLDLKSMRPSAGLATLWVKRYEIVDRFASKPHNQAHFELSETNG
ncbi:hypothetical protein PHLCEN_2v8575 [Hermanssonia centrifuga]|uniref:Uncharacterized protein n=1 Tax=Hermanssonia centrifuga TaxID=98765 RepID=A0A2R6NT98_9APHY|nr:hypothetical protein PHLCEN_2v8575 [Hermanssonia centrifuga]